MRMFQQSKTQMGLLGQMLALVRVGYENPKARTSPLYKTKTFNRILKNQSPEKLDAAVAKRERKGKFRLNQYMESLAFYHPLFLVDEQPRWWQEKHLELASYWR